MGELGLPATSAATAAMGDTRSASTMVRNVRAAAPPYRTPPDDGAASIHGAATVVTGGAVITGSAIVSGAAILIIRVTIAAAVVARAVGSRACHRCCAVKR